MQNESLSSLIEQALAGSNNAEEQLATFFLAKALATTKQKLRGNLPAEDQEDIALSAVKSFCMGIRDGGIAYQGDGQLFSLLHKIIDGKIRKLWQYHLAQKRDIRKQEQLPEADQGELARQIVEYPLPPESIHVNLEEQVAVDRILAELQTELHGVFAELINGLDEHPRKLLIAMLETDATNEELATKIGRSVASVERYRNLIRHKVETLRELM